MAFNIHSAKVRVRYRAAPLLMHLSCMRRGCQVVTQRNLSFRKSQEIDRLLDLQQP